MIAQWRCSPTKQQQEKSFKNKIVLKEEANYFYDYELCEKKTYTGIYNVQFVFSFRFNFFHFFKLKTLIYIFPHRHFYLFMYK